MGVSRSGIVPGKFFRRLAAALPWRNGRFLLVDAGANPDCHPANLIQFALMVLFTSGVQ